MYKTMLRCYEEILKEHTNYVDEEYNKYNRQVAGELFEMIVDHSITVHMSEEEMLKGLIELGADKSDSKLNSIYNDLVYAIYEDVVYHNEHGEWRNEEK